MPSAKSGFILVLLPLIILTSIFVIGYMFIFPIQIKGISMEPNFKQGQYYLVKDTSLDAGIHKGDVVVYKSPKNTKGGYDFISRVIAEPGFTVRISDGEVWVNEIPMESDYGSLPETTTNVYGFIQEDKIVTVPDNHYFVLGDNRVRSADSREWGFLPKENIKGKVWMCYANCD